METLTVDKLSCETERLKGVISGLLSAGGGKVEGFLDKLTDPSGSPIKLNNLLGVVGVIDRDYHTLPAGSFPGHGPFSSEQLFAPLLGDIEAGRELQRHLADCVSQLRTGRPDLVEGYPRLFS
jgi:hypothetical protein